MCYNVAYIEKRGAKYAARYQTVIGEQQVLEFGDPDLPASYFLSGFTHPYLPLVKQDGISLFAWGLIPAWAKDESVAKDIRTKTLNAMSETAFEKPSFKRSISGKRALLGVRGFYEWRDVNKVKYPYFISTKDEEFTSLACIYEEWINKQTAEVIPTFSILTTPANALMQKIHNVKMRMPLIIHRKDEAAWVDPDLSETAVKKLLLPFDASLMEAHPVSQRVNNARNVRDVPESMDAVEYPELLLLDA